MERFKITHSKIEKVLAILSERDSDVAVRTAFCLKSLLQWVDETPWHEIAWEFSRLTGDGFPLELVFALSSSALRYTVEIAGPEVAHIDRLGIAHRVIGQLEGKSSQEALLDVFARIQCSGTLQYGTWVGGCHDVNADRFKLYLEIPEEGVSKAGELLKPFTGELPSLSTRLVVPRMIGYELLTGSVEIYFRVKHLQPWELTLLLRQTGLADNALELLEFIEEAIGSSVEKSLPGSIHGFSISVHHGLPRIFSFFGFARSMLGGDAAIRRKIIRFGKKQNWNIDGYKKITEPLADKNEWATNHGMIAFSTGQNCPPTLTIGLRPPDAILSL